MADRETALEWRNMEDMTDREIAEETLVHLRSVAEAIAELQQTPMMRAMQSGGNPFMAMIRG